MRSVTASCQPSCKGNRRVHASSFHGTSCAWMCQIQGCAAGRHARRAGPFSVHCTALQCCVCSLLQANGRLNCRIQPGSASYHAAARPFETVNGHQHLGSLLIIVLPQFHEADIVHTKGKRMPPARWFWLWQAHILMRLGSSSTFSPRARSRALRQPSCLSFTCRQQHAAHQ